MEVVKQTPLSLWLQAWANEATTRVFTLDERSPNVEGSVAVPVEVLRLMAETAEELEATLARVSKQRDNAVHRIQELVGDLDTHREFWRRSTDAVEEHKTTASQAEHRAKTMQKRLTQRRIEDRRNAALAEAVLGWVNDPRTPDPAITAEAKLDALHDVLKDAFGGMRP